MQTSRQIEQVNSSFNDFKSTPTSASWSGDMRPEDMGREMTPVLALVAIPLLQV